MTRTICFAFCLLLLGIDASAAEDAPAARNLAGGISHAAADWPWWRGPQANGVADANQSPPLHWSKDQNVAWKAPLPGRGHSSPIVVGNRVVITTAEEDREIQSVLCFDRKSGAELWRTAVHEGGLDRKGNKKTSQASSTVACDGERLIVNFLNGGAIYTTALDLNGRRLWQTKVSDFATHQGFGSSAALYGPHAFITTDNRSGGVIAALDRATGKIVWQQQRPTEANYASAVVLNAAGRDQLVVQGCDLISSFDPPTGKKLWEIEGSTVECVTSPVTDGSRIFASGGYPRKHVQAVAADGSGKTAWESNIQVYVPSMIVHEGHLYASQDAGVASCWKSDTGEELWKERLGGTFTASLVLVGENLFATNESGQTFIFKANPARFELVAQNQLGDEVYATPTICGSRIYHRVVERVGDKRQEMLYCLASAAPAEEKPVASNSLHEAVTIYASFDEAAVADVGGQRSLQTRFNHETEAGQFVLEPGFDEKVFRVAAGKGVHGGALAPADVLPRNGRIFFPAKGNIAFQKGGWSGAVSFWLNTDPNKLLKTKFCDPVQITQKGANNGGIWFDFNDAMPRDARMGVFPAVAAGQQPIKETDADAPLVRVKGVGFKAGEWHHVVLNWQNFDTGRADAVAELFIDGQPIGRVADRPIAMDWDLEKTGIYVAVNYLGLLDELAVFSRSLTAAEIASLHREPGALAGLRK